MGDTMGPQRWRRLLEVFEAACDLDGEKRSRLLDAQCSDDTDLRHRLEIMLRSHDQTCSPLDEPIAQIPCEDDEQRDPLIGKSIGRNRIIRRIGRGGMGVVYEAQQEQPQRTVALKVIRQGLTGRRAIRRFEFEAQILGRLHHPGIAQIYEAGTFDLGEGAQPYFAMELVDGAPITQFAADRNLTPAARLSLLIDVCKAVHHAHQRGVIHRDLKPTNILVQSPAGSAPGLSAQPKVLDFGVAKVTDSDFASSTLLTSHDQVIGTIAYMSPEQLEGNAEQLSALTDVYSLGVIGYELLVGRLPYEAASGSMFEMMRQIREQSPARLSAINRRLRGDLETIFGKALEKQPQRRYASAAELAADLRAYIDDRPIAARPPSTIYQLSKFTKRNKPLVAGIAALFALLLIGLIVTSALYLQAEEARAEAFAARDAQAEQRTVAEQSEIRALAAEAKAQQRADELEQVAAFQQSQLADIDTALMGSGIRASIIERGRSALEASAMDAEAALASLAELEALLASINFTNVAIEALDEHIFERALATIEHDFADQPLVKARLLQTVADSLRDIGLLDRALNPQVEALAIRRGELGDDHPETLVSINNMGVLLQRQGKLTEAEQFWREALEGRRRVLGEEHPSTLTSMNTMGFLLRSQGRFDEAEPYHRQALMVRRRVLGDAHPQTLDSINSMGMMLRDQGKLDEAEPYYREALDGRRRVLGDDHHDTLRSILNMGMLLRQLGRLADAEPYYREALDGYRRLLGDDHPETLASINNMGILLYSKGRLADAEPYWREAMERYGRVLGEDHPGTLTSINNMAALLRQLGRAAEAEPLYRQALRDRRRVLGDEHPDTLSSINNLGAVLRDLGRLDEAEQLGAEAVERASRSLPQGHWLFAVFLGHHGQTLAAMEDFAQAEQRALESYAIFKQALGPRHDRTANAARQLTDLYDAWHDAEPDAGYDAQAATWRIKEATPAERE